MTNYRINVELLVNESNEWTKDFVQGLNQMIKEALREQAKNCGIDYFEDYKLESVKTLKKHEYLSTYEEI